MPDFRRKALPGRFGVSINKSAWSSYGIAAPITASATSLLLMPGPYGKFVFNKASVAVLTAAAGGGAITAQFFKRLQGTSTDIALTGTYDLIAGALNKRINVALTAGLTDAQRTFQSEIDPSSGAAIFGDLLLVKLVAASTVTTQPVFALEAELFDQV